MMTVTVPHGVTQYTVYEIYSSNMYIDTVIGQKNPYLFRRQVRQVLNLICNP